MTLVKHVDCIARPLTHIYKQSFQVSIFPNQMKLEKVIPICKNGKKNIHFLTTDQFLCFHNSQKI